MSRAPAGRRSAIATTFSPMTPMSQRVVSAAVATVPLRMVRSNWSIQAPCRDVRNGVPTGIRTPVTAVKGRCPRPLDDGVLVELGTGAGGGNRDRTGDLLHAMQALSQLSYTPSQGRGL